MNRFRSLGMAVVLVWAALACAAAEPNAPKEGASAAAAVEVVVLRDGRRYEGLIESEEDGWVNLTQIKRSPGKPMHLVIRPLSHSDIEHIERLPAPARAALRRQIEQFVHRARIEEGRMDAVQLTTSSKAGVVYQHFSGRWFQLDCTLDEQTTRRLIVRVEQAFTGFRQLLPPRQELGRALRLIVFGSLAEYQQYLRGLNLRLENRACYLPKENLVLAASELALYAAELAKVTQGHERVRAELKALERKLAERMQQYALHLQQSGLSNGETARLLTQEKQKANREIAEKQKLLQTFDRQNARDFDKLSGQLFQRLYHEALHAYVENYVFPAEKYDVPLWLHEGLAVMVEGGQWEGSALRIDAPNRDALRRFKADLAAGRSPPLSELLAAGQPAFLVRADRPTDESQRYYAAAWALTFYLTYERNLLDEKALEAYLLRASQSVPAVARFERLIGGPLAPLEKAWRDSLSAMR